MRVELIGRNSRRSKAVQLRRALLSESRGAELIEFALMLPFFLAFLIGVIDFGGAFLLQQKLAGAAQEGVRIATVQTMSGLSTGASSTTIPKVRDAVVNSLKNSNLSLCGVDTATATYSNYTWTYTSTGTCSGAATLTINRALLTQTPTIAGIYIVQTQVTLSYPYTWKIGQVMTLFKALSSSSLTLPATITVQETAKNST
jgi:Flp pilus assembly protein TadG